ncbi:MAG: response regulator transcription factor [Desulfobacterales bacterium]
MKQPKARILVVEDDTALLRGLLDVLVFNGYEAKGIEDGGAGLKAGLDEQFDLILLDVMLPSLDGFSICRKIRRQKPNQGIIIITAKGAEDEVVSGFKAGADDYITKPFSLREVMVRVEAKSVELTRREMDIIIYLHRHRERIVSKKELLVEVWRYADADIETRTVDIHMLKLRKKIAALIGEPPVIQTVRGEGYRLWNDE